MKGVKYTAHEKQKALKLWIVEGVDVYKVAKKFKCTIQSLYRWRRKYDGTIDSLKNKSSRPHTPHPNAHTDAEAAQIAEVLASCDGISYAEVLGVMRTKYAYSRTYGGMYRFIMKHKLRPRGKIKTISRNRTIRRKCSVSNGKWTSNIFPLSADAAFTERKDFINIP